MGPQGQLWGKQVLMGKIGLLQPSDPKKCKAHGINKTRHCHLKAQYLELFIGRQPAWLSQYILCLNSLST